MRRVVLIVIAASLAGLGRHRHRRRTRFERQRRLILQVNASPPRAGSAARPQPAALDFSSLVYTSDGLRSSRSSRTIKIRFTGFRFHPSRFAKCLESKLEKTGPSACPAASKLGTGSATADARPVVPTPVQAKVQAFNGTLDIDDKGKSIPPQARDSHIRRRRWWHQDLPARSLPRHRHRGDS